MMDPASATSRTILVVEDNPASRRMVRATLAGAGYAVVEAPDGRTALELARRTVPDLVLQDLLLPDADGFELGHPTVLVQAVANLLGNAVKFVARGVQPAVRVRAESGEGRVRLWVEDNGIGIASEHRERIFGVFERLHGTDAYPGTGIGLAIVRRGMARLGGQVGVASDPGRGSRFWLDLPAAPPA